MSGRRLNAEEFPPDDETESEDDKVVALEDLLGFDDSTHGSLATLGVEDEDEGGDGGQVEKAKEGDDPRQGRGCCGCLH